MIRYIELIEPFDQNGYTPNSVMASSPNGDLVLYSEAQAEIDVLKAQRDVAIKHIAEWCVAIQQNGAGWDDWDEYYKKACCRDNALPEIRELLDAAIKKARSDELGVQS